MKSFKNIEEFLDAHSERKKELEALRGFLLDSTLEETIKWGMPVYCLKGKHVAGLGAFKSYVGIWFYNGAFLKDQARVLEQGGDQTRGMRQWRFESLLDIQKQKDLIRAYIHEALENQKAGKEIKPRKKKALAIPEELLLALKKDLTLKAAFEGLTPGRQREYAEYIGEAKKAETRQKRLEKCLSQIEKGLGLMDKYR